jgi:alanyl-tRNA synthetase
MLRIISESSIAAGIRRIEAATGAGVEYLIDGLQDTIADVTQVLGSTGDIRTAIGKAIRENADLHKQVEDFFAERVETVTQQVISAEKERNGVKVFHLTGIRIPELVKQVAFNIKKRINNNFIFVGTTIDNDKPLLTIMLSDDMLAKGFNASQTVREAAKLIKGGGGGQPFFAQAGGKDKDGLMAASEKIAELLKLK